MDAPLSITKALYTGMASAVLLLCLQPIFRDATDDAYPFSTYPMFASRRTTPVFQKAEGTLRNGKNESIPPRLLGTDEVMQAMATVKRAASGKKSARKLCWSILKAANHRYAVVRLVEVKYDPVAYFTRGPHPLSRKILVSCRERRARRKGR